MPTHGCRGCDSGDVLRVVDLGPQPAADYFPPMSAPGDDPRWPLELWFCRACTLVQLGPVEPRLPEPALAVESATSLAHAETSVRDLVRDYPELSGATVVEFHSHHGGSWRQHLLGAGCRTVTKDERAHLVVDVHGLAHEPAIGRPLAERVERLAPGGLLVLEFHHLLPLLVDSQFDTVRHGHWSYLSLGALSRLAAPLGFAVASVRQVPLFGGCLQVMPAPRTPTMAQTWPTRRSRRFLTTKRQPEWPTRTDSPVCTTVRTGPGRPCTTTSSTRRIGAKPCSGTGRRRRHPSCSTSAG